MTPSRRLGAALVALGVAACARRPSPPTPAPAASPPAAGSAATSAPPAAEIEPPEPLEPRDPSDVVTIKLLADARREAHVFWGRKDLGVAPLELKRPRGSGPLDLLVVAPGSLPLHTRAFTDRDESLALHFYSTDQATGLLGWKPPDADADPGVKAGKPGPNRTAKPPAAPASSRHRF